MTKPRTIYHEDCEWVKKSAYMALEKENQRLRSALESFKLYGTTDCLNNNDGYKSKDCIGRVTLFISNEKCIGCDPKAYEPRLALKGE